jgi:DNA-binding transcriptional regulator YiaG
MTTSGSTTGDLRRLARVRRWVATGEARRIREEARLSASAVARAADISHVSVLRYESGRVPSGDAALRYGRVLEALRRETERAS